MTAAAERRRYRDTVFDRADEMKPLEAVEYLKGVVLSLSEAVAIGAPHPVDGWGVHFTNSERCVLIVLYDAKGAIKTHEQLHEALLSNPSSTGDLTDMRRNVLVAIHRLRRKIPSAIGKIINHRGIGYSFERPSKP